TVQTVTSADGTSIAFEGLGQGPALVLLGGAFCSRSATGPLADALQYSFTVFNVDRRGRGDSGDTRPYGVEREIEDIAAVIDAAGGSASVFGHSSGATLALRAAAHGAPITKLVLYEPPFDVDGERPPLAGDFPKRLDALVEEGRRGDAVELYQAEAVGMPLQVVEQLRGAPFRPSLEAIAHTLAYDAAVVGDLRLPHALSDNVTVPTLVIAGENSPPLLGNAARALAEALPAGTLRVLEGQSHDVDAAVTAGEIERFLLR
ncbi:MAG: alpha/beta fold hydrolase, partial [Candidatus Dormibacteria bacterium]